MSCMHKPLQFGALIISIAILFHNDNLMSAFSINWYVKMDCIIDGERSFAYFLVDIAIAWLFSK